MCLRGYQMLAEVEGLGGSVLNHQQVFNLRKVLEEVRQLLAELVFGVCEQGVTIIKQEDDFF